ncbi:MAG TPA: hypothetical protein VIL97_01960, partial [Thermoanaerobaculia bacterium]
ENYLAKRILWYRIDGSRRYSVAAHLKVAYVWQEGRFIDDENFWRSRVKPETVKVVRHGRGLRFFLETAAELDRFRSAVENELQSLEFQRFGPDEDDEEAAF